MNARRDPRKHLAAILIAVLVGGGVMTVTPAGAEATAQVATNWKKIWKKKLAPLADKRYYKKADSDAKYSTKTETSTALTNFYTKADSDAKYQPKGAYEAAGSGYSKAESDAKYAPSFPSVIRGVTLQSMTAAGAAEFVGDNISFGVTLSAAPTAHYIALGDPVPVGCSGTPAAPNAAAGHLCVFEAVAINKNSNVIATPTGAFGATSIGAVLVGRSANAGDTNIATAWAVRPTGIASGPGGVSSLVPSGKQSVFNNN